MPKRGFFSRISRSWDEHHATPEEQERLRLFSVHFRLQAGERVLDAGCGSGRLIPMICRRIGPGGSLVELDFAPDMLELGRRKAGSGQVEFILADCRDLPFPDHEFDRVIALALLPHLDDKAAALGEFHRVLKPHGMLVIAHQLGREALDRLHRESGDEVKEDRLPRRPILTAMLTKAGFPDVELQDEADRYIAWARA
jgi:ubiquinone/menaquinone biosynthesis C-methylase UbiE